jgi:hypothetical protein
MILARPLTRHHLTRAAQCLTAITIAGAALATAGGAQAQTAVPAATTRAAPAGAITPHPIALSPGWSGSTEYGSRPPAWYIDNSGVVHLEGAVTWVGNGPPDHTIGSVGPAATPVNSSVFTIAHTFNGTYTDLQVDSYQGEIAVIDAVSPAVSDYHFLSLEGISYRVSGKTHPITVNSLNWTATSSAGARAPAWYKDRSGAIHLQGAFAQTNPNGPYANVLGVLPLSAAPDTETVYTIAITAPGTYADIAIQPSGAIDIIDPRPPAVKYYVFVSLESITYRPGDAGATPIPLASDWSGNAQFNSRAPAWYKDSSGLIHLQGAVTQTSTSGTTPDVIGTLPAAARPASNVYTIVHTYLGTYADLVIFATGQIALIDPRPPLVKDYSFVSLESITYRR